MWDRDKANEANRRHYHANIDKMREYGRIKKARLYRDNPAIREHCKSYVKKKRAGRRLRCIVHYSNGSMKCGCCGESAYEFLSIDHINGGGHRHRKELGESGSTLFEWLIKQGFPEGYRVLCYNCNCSLGYYGYCPHTKVNQIVVGP